MSEIPRRRFLTTLDLDPANLRLCPPEGGAGAGGGISGVAVLAEDGAVVSSGSANDGGVLTRIEGNEYIVNFTEPFASANYYFHAVGHTPEGGAILLGVGTVANGTKLPGSCKIYAAEGVTEISWGAVG